MTHSLCLLVATLAAGGEPMPAGAQPAYAPAPAVSSYPAPAYAYPAPQERPGFFGRLKNKLFGHKQGCPYQQPQGVQYQVVPQAAPVGAEPPLADVPVQQTAYPVVPVSPYQQQQAQPRPADPTPEGQGAEESEEKGEPGQELNKKYVEKVGHEDDYSWVTGQLYAVRTGSGIMWVVRYATVDTEDKYGGAIVLAPAVNMKNFREGDLVSVRGEIINDGRGTKYLGGPLYRATSIDMIERAD